MGERATNGGERSRLLNGLGASVQTLAGVITVVRLTKLTVAAFTRSPGPKLRPAGGDRGGPRADETGADRGRGSVFDRHNLKYAPLVMIVVAGLEGLPLYAAKGQGDPAAGWISVALGGIAGALGWSMAGSLNTMKIRRGFPLTAVALTWGLLGGLTVGFKFYASEVGGDFLQSTLLIAVAMGVVSGVTGSVTRDEPLPFGLLVKTALLFAGAIGIVRLFDYALVVALLADGTWQRKAWYAVRAGLLSSAVVAPLALVSLWAAGWAGRALRPVFEVYDAWWAGVRELGGAVGGFLIAYLLTVVTFACQFWGAWQIDPCRFYACKAPGEADRALSFGDFLYFSVLTITSAGPGDVPPPAHFVTRALVSLELLAGVVLTTLLVSVLFAVFQKGRRGQSHDGETSTAQTQGTAGNPAA